jgi:hypothetical protein
MNDKIWCYLTAEADKAVKGMIGLGLDADLALSVLEQLWPEQAIYDIPMDGDEGSDKRAV